MRAGTASTIDGPPNFVGATAPLRSTATPTKSAPPSPASRPPAMPAVVDPIPTRMTAGASS
jgi:hypothetical protein